MVRIEAIRVLEQIHFLRGENHTLQTGCSGPDLFRSYLHIGERWRQRNWKDEASTHLHFLKFGPGLRSSAKQSVAGAVVGLSKVGANVGLLVILVGNPGLFVSSFGLKLAVVENLVAQFRVPRLYVGTVQPVQLAACLQNPDRVGWHRRQILWSRRRLRRGSWFLPRRAICRRRESAKNKRERH